MLPYWVVFAILASYSLAYRKSYVHARARQTDALASSALLWLLLTIFVGFRYKVGGDWPTYNDMYKLAQVYALGKMVDATDPVFGLLLWSSARADLGIIWVNVVCAALMMWGVLRFARKQDNPGLALLVGYPYLIIVIGMGYTRQGVAIGLLMAGLATFDGRRIGVMLLYGLAAALFHKTALLVLPLILWPLVQHNRLYAIVGAAVFAALFYFLLRGATDTLITNYVESSRYQSGGAAIRVMMNVAPAIAVLAFGPKLGFTDYQSKMWRVFAFVSLATVPLVLLASFSTAIDRLALFLIPLQVAVLPRLPYAFGRPGKPNPQVMAAVVSYSAAVQLVWLVFATHARYWVPYQAAFFNA